MSLIDTAVVVAAAVFIIDRRCNVDQWQNTPVCLASITTGTCTDSIFIVFSVAGFEDGCDVFESRWRFWLLRFLRLTLISISLLRLCLLISLISIQLQHLGWFYGPRQRLPDKGVKKFYCSFTKFYFVTQTSISLLSNTRN